MEENNLVSFNSFVLKKDLETFTQALYKQTIALQLENEKLLNKIAHLEELLKNVDVPIIGE